MKKFTLGLLVSVSLFGSDFDNAVLAFENGDYNKAAKLYQKACDGGYAGGCHNLGIMYGTGKGVKLDYDKAATLFTKACDSGIARGCFGVGLTYARDLQSAKNYYKAKASFGKACDMGDQDGCDQYAELQKQGYIPRTIEDVEEARKARGLEQMEELIKRTHQ